MNRGYALKKAGPASDMATSSKESKAFLFPMRMVRHTKTRNKKVNGSTKAIIRLQYIPVSHDRRSQY
jgi:hypothetical protein